MRSFHTIAIPHEDILAGRLTMDVFAADLWEVSQDRGPDEYKDAATFFSKTYLTQGLDNLLRVVERKDCTVEAETRLSRSRPRSAAARLMP